MKLNKGQQAALEQMRKPGNYYLYGAAGTGKSTVLKEFLKESPDFAVIAPTAVAAMLLGPEARTVNSFFGIGIMDENSEAQTIVQQALSNPKVRQRIKSCKGIFWDECSMVNASIYEISDVICRIVLNNREESFGGLKQIISGDYYQLCPVQKDKNKPTPWLFKSFSYEAAEFTMIELDEYMRTKNVQFLDVLKNVREGKVTKQEIDFFNSHLLKQGEEFEGTRVLARRKEVDDYNNFALAKIKSPLRVFETIYEGEESYIEKLRKSVPMGDQLRLKVGAFVMTRINKLESSFNGKPSSTSYYNGLQGHITHMDNNSLIIKTVEGREIIVNKHLFEITDADLIVKATAYNFPVTQADALTIHKSQGTSLARCVVSLKGLWDSGQAYVALSRSSDPNNLRITGYDRRSFFVDKAVVDFYNKNKPKAP